MDAAKGYLALRDQIFEQLVPLLDSEGIDPNERFQLSLRVAQLKGDLHLYEKAFHAAQAMGGNSDKLQAYLDLLGDVDMEIQEMADESDQGEPVNEASTLVNTDQTDQNGQGA